MNRLLVAYVSQMLKYYWMRRKVGLYEVDLKLTNHAKDSLPGPFSDGSNEKNVLEFTAISNSEREWIYFLKRVLYL